MCFVVKYLYSWFATTAMGIEDIAAEEITRSGGSSVEVGVGKVFFKANLEAMYRLNYTARTINRLFLLLTRDVFERLEDVYRIAKSVDYAQFISPDSSFAVRSVRVGVHDFTSIDVSRVVGQAVIDSYVSSRGSRLRVNLKNPDVEIGVYVHGNEVVIGINTTGESLHKRRYRVYNHPAALKTTLATAMLRIAGYSGQPLLDPLCGGATIPIEAAHMARKYPVRMFREDYLFYKLLVHDPHLEREVREKIFSEVNYGKYQIFCMEISPKHVKGAVENVKSAKVADTVEIIPGDATREESYRGIDPELVVTNPPYGVRSHNLKRIESFYQVFLSVLRNLYSGRVLVLITASTRQFESAANRVGVYIRTSRTVAHGGLQSRIYTLRL